MKESTKAQFKKLAAITGEKCKTCPINEKHRCCDKMFCNMNIFLMQKNGISIPEQPNVAGIPFMGENGCVLPPEHRPYCTGYVCPSHFVDRTFRREYDRIITKIGTDPAAPPMPEIMSKNRQDMDKDQEVRKAYWRYLKKGIK